MEAPKEGFPSLEEREKEVLAVDVTEKKKSRHTEPRKHRSHKRRPHHHHRHRRAHRERVRPVTLKREPRPRYRKTPVPMRELILALTSEVTLLKASIAVLTSATNLMAHATNSLYTARGAGSGSNEERDTTGLAGLQRHPVITLPVAAPEEKSASAESMSLSSINSSRSSSYSSGSYSSSYSSSSSDNNSGSSSGNSDESHSDESRSAEQGPSDADRKAALEKLNASFKRSAELKRMMREITEKKKKPKKERK